MPVHFLETGPTYDRTPFGKSSTLVLILTSRTVDRGTRVDGGTPTRRLLDQTLELNR